MAARRALSGTVYLLHLVPALGHAAHYIGFTCRPLGLRLADHQAGRGSRLLRAQLLAGGSFVVARTWRGSRSFERQLHRRKNSPRLCPICRGEIPCMLEMARVSNG